MLDFNLMLKNLNNHKFRYVKPTNTEEAYTMVKEAIYNNQKIAIRGDWDVDGGLSAKIIYNYFKRRLITPLVFFGNTKSHGVLDEDIEFCKSNNIGLYIVVDSSSNSLDILNKIANNGTKVIVIDHHVTTNTYKDFEDIGALLINSTLPDNKEIKSVSAGFLCHLVTAYWDSYENRNIDMQNLIFGYITLISDNCETDDPYLIDVVLNAYQLSEHYLPAEVHLFWDKFSTLTRKWLSFKFNNILNNAFRLNRIDLILDLFFNDDTEVKQKAYDNLQALNSKTKEQRNELIIKYLNTICKVYNGVVFVNLDEGMKHTELPKEYVLNSTGLFASNVSDLTNKPTIAYITQDEGIYKCSGRDIKNVFPFQDILRQYDLDGGGHYSAVGFKVPKLELNELFNIGQRFKDVIDKKPENLINVKFNDLLKSEFNVEDICSLISANNEVAHTTYKHISIEFNLEEAEKITEFSKMTSYKFFNLEVKDLLKKCSPKDTVLAEPSYTETNTLLISSKISV